LDLVAEEKDDVVLKDVVEDLVEDVDEDATFWARLHRTVED
jgi:hypothetical protein